jgi:hypothetical protein
MLSPLTQNQGRQIFFAINSSMKLCQGQVWKSGKQYIRIVKLERLAVAYKSMPNLGNKEGTLHQTSKKDFCRLLKGAHLLPPGKKISPARKEADAAAAAR